GRLRGGRLLLLLRILRGGGRPLLDRGTLLRRGLLGRRGGLLLGGGRGRLLRARRGGRLGDRLRDRPRTGRRPLLRRGGPGGGGAQRGAHPGEAALQLRHPAGEPVVLGARHHVEPVHRGGDLGGDQRGQ